MKPDAIAITNINIIISIAVSGTIENIKNASSPDVAIIAVANAAVPITL